jgi:hypothetical protein
MADYSADCNPAVFNRLARYLRNQSKPAPAQDASLSPSVGCVSARASLSPPEPRRSRVGYLSEVTHIEQVFER